MADIKREWEYTLTRSELRAIKAEAWAEGHAAGWSHRLGPLSNPYKDPA